MTFDSSIILLSNLFHQNPYLRNHYLQEDGLFQNFGHEQHNSTMNGLI